MGKKRTTFESLIDKFDMFGAEVPSMTIDAKTKLGTSVGFFATIFFSLIMLGFFLIQLWIVTNHINPLIAVEENSDAFISTDDQLDMNHNNDFFMAFTVLKAKTKEIAYDEDLVRWMGLISEGDGI
jgi:hypothetical protein